MFHCKKLAMIYVTSELSPSWSSTPYLLCIVTGSSVRRGGRGRFRFIFLALLAPSLPFEGGDLSVSREPEWGGVVEGPALSARFLSCSLLFGLIGVSGFAAVVADAIAVETAGEVWLFFEWELSIEVGTVVGVSWLFGQVSSVWTLMERVAGGWKTTPHCIEYITILMFTSIGLTTHRNQMLLLDYLLPPISVLRKVAQLL